MRTGIASSLIRTTTELGGDKPWLTCILICIVTTAIFSSVFGAGAVIAIGVIKDGRPAIDYSVVGGHRTYITSQAGGDRQGH